MALGVEPKEIDLMKRQPRNPKQGVLTKVTWLIIFIQSMLIALLTIAVYVIALNHLNYTVEAAQSLVNRIHSVTWKLIRYDNSHCTISNRLLQR
jgi:Ca2+-transporting ATPase